MPAAGGTAIRGQRCRRQRRRCRVNRAGGFRTDLPIHFEVMLSLKIQHGALRVHAVIAAPLQVVAETGEGNLTRPDEVAGIPDPQGAISETSGERRRCRRWSGGC